VDDKIKKEMGTAYGMYGEGRGAVGYSWGILRGGNHLEDLGIVERIL
jgi:hypothetical protein